MIIIQLTYTKPLEDIDAHLSEHRDFLSGLYERGVLLASGPQEPRTGGIIISLLDDMTELKNIMADDPFNQAGLCDYAYTRFNAVKCHHQLQLLIK